jgi:hypothetical protein
MGDQIRVLKEVGIQKFRGYLAELRNGLMREPPAELLTDASFSSIVMKGLEVENRFFNSKLEIAKYFYDKFQILPQLPLEENVGLWSWLSLYYFEQLYPADNSGGRNPGQDSRHILDLDYRLYRYHLLLGPYHIYRLHGERAPLLLSSPLYETSKYYLELSARQGFITNKGVIEAASLLFFDPMSGKPKRGAAVTTRKPGTPLRFIDVVQQLDLTYDLYSITGEEVLDLLPSEFDEWRPNQPLPIL